MGRINCIQSFNFFPSKIISVLLFLIFQNTFSQTDSLEIWIKLHEKKPNDVVLLDKNEIIEHKNKEITDSIHYAKRIQTALLPSEKHLEKTINRLKDRPK